ncbi:hypothetical protein NIES3974_17190 [Calothrix sp. NIES-3974]|nr:hypothetical protein NIES3974_17190 [Calothrix sp. NIES-3974]
MDEVTLNLNFQNHGFTGIAAFTIRRIHVNFDGLKKAHSSAHSAFIIKNPSELMGQTTCSN